MALVLKDRVKETTATAGTGTVTLAGASTGYQSFSAIGNANTTYYCIAGQGTAEWEVGIGTYTASGTTLSRDTILASSNSGSVVTFSAGTKDVFVVYPAGKSINLDASGNATALGTPASCTVTNFTGTASININGTVGATTPSTGAFTTLSATGVATFSAGSAAAPAITTSGDTNNGIFFPAADVTAITTAGSERMRINSSGNLLVGTTSVPSAAGVSGSNSFVRSATDATWTLLAQNTAASGGARGIIVNYSGQSPNDTTNEAFFFYDSVGTRFGVRSNGGIENYQANDANLSDRREKTNFAPAKSYLDTICAIPVQTFNYIDQNMEDDPGLTLGVVAQDVQAVAPEMVMESNWAGQDEEPKMRLSIYQTDLQYALMKCIQELKAELDTAKARIAALEAQ